jgi:hypothetical protein
LWDNPMTSSVYACRQSASAGFGTAALLREACPSFPVVPGAKAGVAQ